MSIRHLTKLNSPLLLKKGWHDEGMTPSKGGESLELYNKDKFITFSVAHNLFSKP